MMENISIHTTALNLPQKIYSQFKKRDARLLQTLNDSEGRLPFLSQICLQFRMHVRRQLKMVANLLPFPEPRFSVLHTETGEEDTITTPLI